MRQPIVAARREKSSKACSPEKLWLSRPPSAVNAARRRSRQGPLAAVPADLTGYQLELAADGHELVYTFDAQAEHTGIAELLRELSKRGVDFKDLKTDQSSLEEIFVSLVRSRP